MTRIRVVFALVCAALLACAVPLVRRAFDSVALERAARHDLVSSRIFDEMERALLDLVSREEERPFEHYRFYYAPEAAVGGRPAPIRSPLAPLPEAPYLLGYFQIDPDGSLHTPHRPRDEAFARHAGDWRPVPELERALGALRTVLERHRPALGGAGEPDAEFAVAPQAPGTTVALERAEAPRPLGQAPDAAPQEARKRSLYDAVSALNRGTAERAPRRAKVEQRRAYELFEGGAGSRAADEEAAPPAPATSAAVRVSPTRARDDARSLARLESDAAHAAPPEPEAARGAPIEVTYEPFAGRPLDDRHFALLRRVRLGATSYRQGVLIDLAALTAHLRRIGVGAGGLAGVAELSFVGAGLPDDGPDAALDAYLYQRRFAEPFEALGARLALAPLPDPGGSAYVYTLAVLLVLVGSLGLWALYRMVFVAVSFAERRSNFAAAVSHELKTPLTAIRMYAEMLRDGMVPEPRRRQYYGTITAESERLSRLIDNVLEFSRLERGSREMHLASGPIGPCVREAVATLHPHAEREGFRIEIEMEEALPPARFDRDALLQVLFNLLDNAIKYAHAAPDKRITVQCRRDGERVVLRVRDRGPGIPARHLPRIFEAFYRGENELVRTSKGAGLGLALVKGLVGRMGGTIQVRSPEDGGLEVTVALPAAPAG